MRFADIIGQQEARQQLIQTIRNGRIPHAQLFFGPPGNGKYALALSYVQYLNCANRSHDDSCGTCPSCVKINKLAHPDVHFFFPTTTTKKVKKDPESKLYADEWRTYIAACQGYPDINDWYDYLGVENKQGTLFVRDASEINRLLGFKPFEGNFSAFVIWMPEKLHPTAANKLLKNLEEPPANTVFLLVAENPEQVLPTIRSRCYQVKVPRIAQSDLEAYLSNNFQLSADESTQLALLSDGNLLTARMLASQPDERLQQMEQFRLWMRLCFDHKYAEIIDFANNTAGMGRERIKAMLEYGLRIFRFVLLIQQGQPEMVSAAGGEQEFVTRFARAVGRADVSEVAFLLEESIRHVERNANTSLLLSSLSFRLARLIGRGV
ncbi:MAG: DNA polymerase III subunit [Bacteroidetes bacterium]|nr:DNA polymerase III subunit [Bacteroidota bacterium]